MQVICEERPRVTAALRAGGFDVADSQANFVWAAHPTLPGGELAARLARSGVLVAAGDALGEPGHVRIAIQSAAATDRLLNAIDKAALARCCQPAVAQQSAGGALEDLAPGADLLVALVEVLHDPAHALG